MRKLPDITRKFHTQWQTGQQDRLWSLLRWLSPPQPVTQAAGPIHTISVLAMLGGWSLYGKIVTDHLSAVGNPNRVRLYVLALVFEWVLFALVVVGVRHHGEPVRVILGDQWCSVRQV